MRYKWCLLVLGLVLILGLAKMKDVENLMLVKDGSNGTSIYPRSNRTAKKKNCLKGNFSVVYMHTCVHGTWGPVVSSRYVPLLLPTFSSETVFH